VLRLGFFELAMLSAVALVLVCSFKIRKSLAFLI
jgi:hypothetical protein